MRRLYDPDDYADAPDTNPGLPCCTIIGPLLPARPPAPPPRVPYHVRYPPTIDDPVSILVRPTSEIPSSLGEFDFDDEAIVVEPDGDHPERFALGSQSKGRAT